MKSAQSICLLLALTASASTFAAHWDSLGSKPSYSRGASSHQRSLPTLDYRHNDSGYRQRNSHTSTSVNIVVGAVPSFSRWSPVWTGYTGYNSYSNNYNYGRPFNSYYPGNAFIFNSSPAYRPARVVHAVSTPVIIHEDHYVREYSEPVRVVRFTAPRSSITLFKDRYGQCFEKETDRDGRIIKRQLEDYACDF